MKKIKVLELFGGIGAPRKALENIFESNNLKFIDYVEYDQMPVTIYNKLYNNDKQAESVVGYDLKPDVLVHGSPCQDFSVAGKGLGGFAGTETKSSLMWETVRIIEDFGKWKPKVVIWENVKGVLNKTRLCKECKTHAKWNEDGTKSCECGETTKTNYDNFNLYLDELIKMGYINHHRILNSKDYGIPQSRNRIFIVSILETEDNFLHFDFDKLIKKPMSKLDNFLEKEVPVEYFLTQSSMLKAVENGKIKIIDNIVSTITTRQMRWNNAGVVKIPFYSFNQENYVHVTYIEKKSDGDNSRIKIFIPTKPNDAESRKLLPVVKLEDDNYYYLRVLTERETWRLMGFTDDDFNKIQNMPKSVKYKVSGNSIVVPVLEAIFKELFNLKESNN